MNFLTIIHKYQSALLHRLFKYLEALRKFTANLFHFFPHRMYASIKSDNIVK